MIRRLAALPADAVRECPSGEEAVRLVDEFTPDIVTMDLRLPGLGGLADTRAICASCPSVKVVMVSAFDQPDLRRAAADAGATGYVVKDNLSALQSLFSHCASAMGSSSTLPSCDPAQGRP